MIRLAIRCRPELAEQALAELVELAPSGVEERSGEGWVEYAVYGPPGEIPELPHLKAAVGDALLDLYTEQVEDDWAERWREFHKPVITSDRRLRVRPPWIEAAAGPGGVDGVEIEIVIEPGRAFGTGAHATTRLCLDLLCELAGAGLKARVADLGTGSGVLAIAAARLKIGPVFGCDNDPAAVAIARQNALANRVEVEFARLDLRSARPPEADLWVANLTAPILRPLAAWLDRDDPTAPAPSRLILSGVLQREAESVGAVYRAAGYRLQTIRSDGEWAALAMVR